VVEIEPLDEIACEGSEVLLNAQASGTEPLNYQWKKNGENINRSQYKPLSDLPASCRLMKAITVWQ